MTEAIISGLSGSDVIFGGDLHTVVSLFDPIIQKYNTANYESFVLITNIYKISNMLLNSSEAWGDVTNFGERYLLSTAILTNIDDIGFLFLSENPFIKGPKISNFSHIGVILDAQKTPTELGFANCYQFNQVGVKKILKKAMIDIYKIHLSTGFHLHSKSSLRRSQRRCSWSCFRR